MQAKGLKCFGFWGWLITQKNPKSPSAGLSFNTGDPGT
jgi:hypothetical protein